MLLRAVAGDPVMRVSRHGSYQWRNRAPSARALRDAELTERIRKIHTAHSGRVGVRRVRDELARAGSCARTSAPTG